MSLAEQRARGRTIAEPGAAPGGTRVGRDRLMLVAGLVMVGLSGYAFLALTARTLGAVGAAPIAVLWTVSNSLGAGLFVPVEQELARRSSALRVRGEGTASVTLRSAQGAAALVVVTGVLAAGFGRPLSTRLFAGQGGLLVCLVVITFGFAAQHVTRGVFAGSDRFGRYGVQLAVDGGLRLAGAATLAACGVRSTLAYAVVLAGAPVLSVLVTLPLVRDLVGGGGQTPWRQVVPAFGLLGAGQMLSVAIIGTGPVAAVLLTDRGVPGEALAASILIGVLLVARAPLLAFYAVQATLLPALARLIALEQRADARRRVAHTLTTVLVAGTCLTVAGFAVGPWAVRLVLGHQYRAGRFEVTAIVAATLLYIAGSLAAQALLAFEGHRWFALTWICGAVGYACGLLVPAPLTTRVPAAFLFGALVSFSVAAVAVALLSRTPERPADQSGEQPRRSHLDADQLR